jgi:hypothetical protein
MTAAHPGAARSPRPLARDCSAAGSILFPYNLTRVAPYEHPDVAPQFMHLWQIPLLTIREPQT